MKKFLQLFALVAALALPWVMKAQTSGAQDSVPFFCNFEDSVMRSHWVMVNQVGQDMTYNHFVVSNDTLANSTAGGQYALYVTDESWVCSTCAYPYHYKVGSDQSGAQTYVEGNTYAYIDIYFPQAGMYDVSYMWKGNGESKYDHARVALVPNSWVFQACTTAWDSTTTVQGQYWGAYTCPSAFISLDDNAPLSLAPTFRPMTKSVNVPSAGVWRMVVMWRNDGNIGDEPPFTIDDIAIVRQSCPVAQNITISHLTQTSATLSWDANSSVSGWVLEWDTINVTNLTHSLFLTANSYTFSNLTAGGRYNVRIRTVCPSGDTSMMVEQTFSTLACPPLTELPYTYDFDDVTTRGSSSARPVIPCWTHFNSASTYYGYPYLISSSAHCHTGTYALYFYYPSSTSSYDPHAGIALPAIDLDSIDIQHVVVSFWLSASSASYVPTIQVGVMTDPNNTHTFVPVDSASTASTTPVFFALPLSAYQGTGNIIALRTSNPASGTYAYGYVDDLTLTYEPCTRPGVRTDSITAHSAHFSWTNLGALYYEYAADTAAQHNPATIYDTTLVLNNLHANTVYTFYLRSVCASGAGEWTQRTFRTQCDYLAMPFTEDFEDETAGGTTNMAFASCWSRLTDAGQYVGYPYVSASTTYNHTPGGTKGVYWYRPVSSANYGSYQVIILPPTIPSVDSLQLGFWTRSSSASYTPQYTIGVLTDPDSLSSFVPVTTVTHSLGITWNYYEVPLNSYTGTGRYIGIRADAGSSAWYSYLDDIVLDYIPSCPRPTDLTFDNATTTSISFHWNGPSNGAEWIISIDTMTFVTTDTFYTVTGLSPSAAYNVYVSAVCNPGDTSNAVNLLMRTSCGALTSVPFFESFENYSAGSTTSRTFIPCWGHLNNASTYMGYPYVNTTLNYAHSGTQSLYFYGTAAGTYGDYEVAVLPAFDTTLLPINTLRLSFWGRPTSATYYPHLYVGVMRDPDSIDSFELVDSVVFEVGTDFHRYEVLLTGYHGRGAYIALKSPRQGTCGFSIDDITVDLAPNCVRPTNIEQIFADVDSLDFQWNGNGASTWLVLFDNNAYEVTDTVFSIGNLDPSTSYTVSVAALCDGDTSEFTTEILRSACAPITNLPWTDDFEDYTTSTTATTGFAPYCYDPVMLASSSMYTTGTYYPMVYYTAASTTVEYYRHNGLYSYRLGGRAYNTLPEFAAPVDSLMLTLWMATSSGAYALEVGILDDSNVFHSLYQPQLSTSMESYTFYFNDYDGPNGRIAFYNYYVGGTYDYSYIYLDDITVDFLPSCVPPTVSIATIGNTSADLLLTGGNASTIEVQYGSNTVTVTDSICHLTGLTPNTHYSIKARSICGAGDTSVWSPAISLRTYCNEASIPFSENFDTYTSSTSAVTGFFPDCWNYTLTNPSYASGSYVPTIYYSGTYSNSGYYSLRLYGNGYHCLPPMGAPLDSLQLSFSNYTTGTSYGLEVGVMEGTTFIPLQDVSNGVSSAHIQHTVYFNGYSGTSRIIAFRNYYTSSGATGYSYNYLDDIEVDYAPSCLPVTAFTTTGVTTTSTTVHWGGTPAPSFEVEYGPAGFTRGTGTTQMVTTDSIVLTGLSSSSTYDIYVRAFCSATDSSLWAPFSFATECGPITAFPYMVNFDDCVTGTTGTIPTCWAKNSNYSTGYPYVSSSYGHSGNTSMYFYYSGNTTHTIAALPPMGVALNNLQVSFYLYRTSTTAGYGEIIVAAMTDPDDYSTIVGIDTVSCPSSAVWTQFTVSLNNYTGNGRYLVFCAAGTSPLVTIGNAYLDDVTVSYVPCVVNVAIDSITTNSASVDWYDDCHSTQWEVEYGPTGYTPGTGSSIITASHPVTLTGLANATDYDVYIRTISSSDTGFWTVPESFSTLCGLIELPYTENFDSYSGSSYSTAGVLPACWDAFSNATTETYRPHIVGSGAIWFCHSGSNALMMTSGSSTYGDTKIARLPELAEPLNNVQLSFWLCTEDNVRQGGYLEVGYLTTDADNAFNNNFVSLLTINSNDSTVHSGVGQQLSNGHTYTLTFDSVPDSARFLAFRWNCTTGYYNCAIDDIVVDFAPAVCPVPVISSVSHTYNTATVAWTADGDNFEVSLKPAAADSWSQPVAVQGTSYTFAELAAETAYQFRVRQLCDSIGASEWAAGSFTTDAMPCFAPTGLELVAENGLAAVIDWTPAEGQSQWEIMVFNTTSSQTYPCTAHPAYVVDLTAGETYYAAVRAICDSNDYSDWSDTLTFTTSVCDPVTSLSASVNGTSATLTWTPGANNSGQWEIEYGLRGFSQGEGTTVQVSANNATISNLMSETTYDAYVRAICGPGYISTWSDKVTFTTEHVGISRVEGQMNISIYPNPANGSTAISISGAEGLVNIAIVDMNGRTLLSDAMECQGDCVKTLNVTNLAQGAYFVRIYSDSVNTVKKLIIR